VIEPLDLHYPGAERVIGCYLLERAAEACGSHALGRVAATGRRAASPHVTSARVRLSAL
jgi:hypothetical protein